MHLVEVLGEDGRWHDGELLAYRREDGVWSRWVHWTAAVGATCVGRFTEDRLRSDGAATID